jgi:hypothetical protein
MDVEEKISAAWIKRNAARLLTAMKYFGGSGSGERCRQRS